jgi:membrane-bound serine protease (ClpP class)
MALIVAAALAIFVLPLPWGVAAIVLALALEVGEKAFWLRIQRRWKVRTGVESHVGERAEVVRACAPEGRVRFRGDLWKARSSEPVAAGERVRVTETDGLTLVVEREPD